jgi:phage shock protein E
MKGCMMLESNKKFFIQMSAVGFSLLLLAGCGSSGTEIVATEVNTGVSSANVDLAEAAEENSILIDVRTPQEYNEGKIGDALNINVESADFVTKISELDPNARYEVYCRSGRRSEIAVDEMRKRGFTNVVDLGGFQEAAAAKGQ